MLRDVTGSRGVSKREGPQLDGRRLGAAVAVVLLVARGSGAEGGGDGGVLGGDGIALSQCVCARAPFCVHARRAEPSLPQHMASRGHAVVVVESERRNEVAGFVLGVATGVAALGLAQFLRKRLRRAREGKRAAVVLSGCGYMDGSECTEAIAILVALSELGVQTQVFAPDANQTDVVDHNSGKPLGYVPRNMMQEAARLSRGNVRALTELRAQDFDALLCPGGFGAAKSLSSWAKGDPAAATCLPEVTLALTQFHQQGKPIGLCCIAPTLACMALPNVKITLGKAEPAELWPYGGTLAAAQSRGADVVRMDVGDVCVDAKNKLVTSPAYMFDGKVRPSERRVHIN